MKVQLEFEECDVSRLVDITYEKAKTIAYDERGQRRKENIEEANHLFWLTGRLGYFLSEHQKRNAAPNLMNPQKPGDKGFDDSITHPGWRP